MWPNENEITNHKKKNSDREEHRCESEGSASMDSTFVDAATVEVAAMDPSAPELNAMDLAAVEVDGTDPVAMELRHGGSGRHGLDPLDGAAHSNGEVD